MEVKKIRNKIRAFSVVLLTSLICLAILLPILSQATVSNMLLEPSVETINYWTDGKTTGMIATLEHVSDAHTGNKALKIAVTYNPAINTYQSALWYQTVRTGFSGGETYKYRAYYKSNVPSSLIVLAYYGFLNSKKVYTINLAPSTTWTQSDWLTFTAPSDTNYIRFDVRLFNTPSTNGYVIFDDFEAYPSTSEPTEPETPQTEPEQPTMIGDYYLLKTNLHTHTTASDGYYSPTYVVNLYAIKGYDVLAITDHNTFMGYTEAKAVGDSLGMVILRGEECSFLWVSGDGNVAENQKHIVALFTDDKVGKFWSTDPDDDGDEFPFNSTPSVQEVFDKIHSFNGIGIVAHAWRAWSYWQDYVNADYVDGWEVDCTSTTNWVFNSGLIYSRSHDYHGDAWLPRLDQCWTYLLAYNKTEAGVKEAILSNRIVVYDNGNIYGSDEALAIYNQEPELPEDDPETPPETPEGMTSEDWENFWTWLKNRQTEQGWSDYLESMLESWKTQFFN